MNNTATGIIVSVLMALIVAGCKPGVVAGTLTEAEICSYTIDAVRRKTGGSFADDEVSCSVRDVQDNRVVVGSSYISPFDDRFDYLARGVVDGDRLRLQQIKVAGVDERFISFNTYR